MPQKFKSVRRALRVLELIAQRGEDLTTKQLAHELEMSLSHCYLLISVLIDEGYVERISHCGGYKLGSVITHLYEGYFRNRLDSRFDAIIDELAQRSHRHAYFAVIEDGETTVVDVKTPPNPPPVGIAKGFHGASHALALGKVLVAGRGDEGVEEYIDNYGLEAFTPRTIIHPATFKAHLNRVRTTKLATDFEEFTENLCCIAAPIEGAGGRVEGAIGVSTTARRIRDELHTLTDLVRWASREASALLQGRCL